MFVETESTQMTDDDAAPVGVTAADKPYRHPAIAKRLNAAFEAHPHAPALHSGRYSWLQSEFAKRGIRVSVEAMRQWFLGHSRPNDKKMETLAEMLGVDRTWLELGHDSGVTQRDRRARNAMATGAVNLVAGLIQMGGGHVAFPDEDDARAERENVDMMAIIRGASYSFHIAVGEEVDGTLRFAVPTRHDEVVVIGVVMDGFVARLFEITPEDIEGAPQRRGATIEVVAAAEDLKAIETFARR